MSDKLTASSGVDPSAKTISVPVFHLYHKLLPGTTNWSATLRRRLTSGSWTSMCFEPRTQTEPPHLYVCTEVIFCVQFPSPLLQVSPYHLR